MDSVKDGSWSTSHTPQPSHSSWGASRQAMTYHGHSPELKVCPELIKGLEEIPNL